MTKIIDDLPNIINEGNINIKPSDSERTLTQSEK